MKQHTAAHDLVRMQSRIKSLYRSRGIGVPGGSVYGARHREQWQERLPASVQRRATRLYEQFDFLAEQKKQAERDLLREARKQPIVRILETAPGFGLIRSARLVPIVTRSLSAAPSASLSHEAARQSPLGAIGTARLAKLPCHRGGPAQSASKEGGAK